MAFYKLKREIKDLKINDVSKGSKWVGVVRFKMTPVQNDHFHFNNLSNPEPTFCPNRGKIEHDVEKD